MSLNDPEVVAREYATERGLEARRAAYRNAEGPNAPELVFEAVRAVAPKRFLEVGSGHGDLSARVAAELGAEVVAVDLSPRMVELARRLGVDARVGDVQELPFADGSFDCAVAAWMLYHVPDVERGLSELARVLRPGGRLVAVTNFSDHLQELRELVGLPAWRPAVAFPAETAAEILERHFGRVEARDASGTVTFPDRASIVTYLEHSITLFEGAGAVPDDAGPLVVRRRPLVLVAEK